MPAKKISDLPAAATPLTGAELIPAVQSGASVRLAASDLTDLTRATTPAFMAYLSATVNDQTGDGTAYNLVFDTELYDRTGNYDNATGLFTAPVAGLYEFKAYILLSGIDTAMNRFVLNVRCKISGVDTQVITGEVGDVAPDVNGRLSIAPTAPVLLATNEQVYMRLAIFGSAKTVDIVGKSAGPPINYGSFFSGRLVG